MLRKKIYIPGPASNVHHRLIFGTNANPNVKNSAQYFHSRVRDRHPITELLSAKTNRPNVEFSIINIDTFHLNLTVDYDRQ